MEQDQKNSELEELSIKYKDSAITDMKQLTENQKSCSDVRPWKFNHPERCQDSPDTPLYRTHHIEFTADGVL